MSYINILFKILLSFILLSLTLSSCKKKDNIEPNSNIVWVVGDRTVKKSTNGGKEWVNNFIPDNYIVNLQIGEVYPTQVFRHIYFNSTLSGSLCGENGLMLKTKNAQNWEGWAFDNRTYYASVMFDSTNYYYCGEDHFVFSNNNGYTPSNKATVFFGIDFINDTTGWVVGDNSAVCYTKNGRQWTQQSTPSGNTYKNINIHKLNNGSREVWIVGDNGIILKTMDNGENWITVISGVSENLTSICFTNDETAYITGEYGLILKTEDNGTSFQKLNSGTSENLNSVSFKDENYGIAVGDFGTFIKTENAGNSWSNESWDRTKNLYCVLFVKRFLQK